MHYVYHPSHEAVIVSTEEYQKYLDSGWYDTPTKFPAMGAEIVAEPVVEQAVELPAIEQVIEEVAEPVIEQTAQQEAAPRKRRK